MDANIINLYPILRDYRSTSSFIKKQYIEALLKKFSINNCAVPYFEIFKSNINVYHNIEDFTLYDHIILYYNYVSRLNKNKKLISFIFSNEFVNNISIKEDFGYYILYMPEDILRYLEQLVFKKDKYNRYVRFKKFKDQIEVIFNNINNSFNYSTKKNYIIGQIRSKKLTQKQCEAIFEIASC